MAAGLEQGRFAIADGVSESSFARLWAGLLVKEFVRADHDPLQKLTWLDRARRRWPELVGSEPLPWDAETKRQEGAFAAFLGVCIGDEH